MRLIIARKPTHKHRWAITHGATVVAVPIAMRHKPTVTEGAVTTAAGMTAATPTPGAGTATSSMIAREHPEMIGAIALRFRGARAFQSQRSETL